MTTVLCLLFVANSFLLLLTGIRLLVNVRKLDRAEDKIKDLEIYIEKLESRGRAKEFDIANRQENLDKRAAAIEELKEAMSSTWLRATKEIDHCWLDFEEACQ